jgi:hypothetical protein
LQAQVDDILQNGDQFGTKTEALSRQYFGQDGWVHQTGGQYGSNNGFDNVYRNPNTGEIIIDESKQWPPVLSGATQTNPKQMTDAWINKVADEIQTNNPVLAQQIRDALGQGKLIKTVTAVKKTNPGYGTIITIKVEG